MSELMLRGGDYLPNGKGGFAVCTGDEALLQRVLFKLTARRGAFPLLPNLGSRLYLLSRCALGERESLARQYAAEALADEPELTVAGVTLTETDSGAAALRVELERQGDAMQVTVEV